MRLLASTCAVALVAGIAPGQILPVSLTGGTQGPFSTFEDDSSLANDNAWFVFTLGTTTDVDIDFNRTSAAPDLFATLYSGDVTGADFGALLADAFTSSANQGPLTFIDSEDDTENDPFGGPFGDPRFITTLGPGTYSIIVTALSPVGGGQFTVTSNVPAPASAMLAGLGGLAASRRRR